MTLTQLLKCLDDIDKTSNKLTKLTDKLDQLADKLNIKQASIGQPPAETLVMLNGEPTRILRSFTGSITIEKLHFS